MHAVLGQIERGVERHSCAAPCGVFVLAPQNTRRLISPAAATAVMAKPSVGSSEGSIHATGISAIAAMKNTAHARQTAVSHRRLKIRRMTTHGPSAAYENCEIVIKYCAAV